VITGPNKAMIIIQGYKTTTVIMDIML